MVEEGKWLLELSCFECTNSVFNTIDENNSFSINIPGHWETEFDRKAFAKINEIIELNSLELHVEEVRATGHKITLGDSEKNYRTLILKKNKILEEIKKAKYNDLEDLVYRMQLTFVEVRDILDLK